VTIEPGEAYARGQVLFLAAPQGDVAAKTGVTFGGTAIKDDGSWKGEWTPLAKPSDKGQFSVTVPMATAAIVRLDAK
jgi:hypothetical protein